MRLTVARVLTVTLIAAGIVFLVVQDRVTAAGVRRYTEVQRLASDGRGPAMTIDEVMGPARRQSLLQGLRWSGSVASTGFVAAAIVWRRSRRG